MTHVPQISNIVLSRKRGTTGATSHKTCRTHGAGSCCPGVPGRTAMLRILKDFTSRMETPEDQIFNF